MNRSDHTPPRWANRFLEWYCNPELLEQIQGDVYEIYDRDIRNRSARIANLKFTWNVIRFFRWSNIKRNKTTYASNSSAMIKNYLLTGFRSALRHRLNSIINITGLALGVAGAVTVFIFIDHQTHSDTFHQNQPRIYQVTNVIRFEDHNENWGDTPLMLAPALSADYAGIEASTRIEYASAAFRYNDLVFNEFMWFVDKDFTRIFDFPVLRGNGYSLDHKDQIILVKEIAEKYFGQSDPIGQQVSIKFGDRKEEFTIGAVIERPNNSSIFPQILLPIAVFERFESKGKQ
ncbi:MAG: ABC transporter permease [Cyclobacteriaceae bacterium]